MKEIQLSQGKVALVDEEDFERVNQFKWFAYSHGLTFYSGRNKRLGFKKRTIELMHCFIMGGIGVDHIDGNGLNNQKSNLRFATNQQNCMNKRPDRNTSSKYKGVSWIKEARMWRSILEINGKVAFYKRYENEVDAALAYDIAAKKYFGEFAYLNFKNG